MSVERREVLGVANAGHYVLALGIDEEVAVRLVLPRCRIAREADPGARSGVSIAEHHCLDVHCGTEVVTDLFPNSVRDRAGAVPRTKHGLDCAAQLLGGILREVLAGDALDLGLVVLAQLPQRRGGKCRVVLDAIGRFRRFVGTLEEMTVDPQHDAPVHGDEPSITVVGESLVVRRRSKTDDAPVVEPEVEHRVHHSRHRELRTGPNGHQQRIGSVTESTSHPCLQRGDVPRNLAVERSRPPASHVIATRVGGDREAVWNRQLEHRGHLRQIRALATEQVLHAHRRLAVLVVEVEHVRHGRSRV